MRTANGSANLSERAISRPTLATAPVRTIATSAADRISGCRYSAPVSASAPQSDAPAPARAAWSALGRLR
jgi:hypothetical protein